MGFSTGLRIALLISLCIILSGDVESNPGPETLAEVMTELKAMRREIERNFQELRHDISTLKTDLRAVNEKVDKNRQDIDSVYDDLYNDIRILRSSVSNLEKQLEDQERYSRRDNVIIHGIPHHTGETPTSTRDTLLKVLNENVTDKVWTDSDFVRVHRLKTKHAERQPIIARLVRTDDKFLILNARPKLKEAELGVSNDLTPAQRNELNSLRQEGKRGFFKNGRLHIDRSFQPAPATERVDQSASQPPRQAENPSTDLHGHSSREFPMNNPNNQYTGRYTRRGGRGANSHRGQTSKR